MSELLIEGRERTDFLVCYTAFVLVVLYMVLSVLVLLPYQQELLGLT